MLKPKSFGGLLGAAPSVALATLGIAVVQHGPQYAAGESWTMIYGAVALGCYSVVVCHLLMRFRLGALPATISCIHRMACSRIRAPRRFRRCGLMLIKLSSSSLKRTHWYEYAVRFVLGGLATVATGLIGSHFGVAIGGLFLALPAIFCASATLIESHERRAKEKAGLSGRKTRAAGRSVGRGRRRSRKYRPRSVCGGLLRNGIGKRHRGIRRGDPGLGTGIRIGMVAEAEASRHFEQRAG